MRFYVLEVNETEARLISQASVRTVRGNERLSYHNIRKRRDLWIFKREKIGLAYNIVVQ